MAVTCFPTCLLFLLLIYHVYPLDYGTCDDPFIIFKHTIATSDSARECENYYAIFPDIHDEGASKFKDGLCAHQCKLELPYTCFKIHAPETQFEQGLLNIDTFEKKLSSKWKYATEHNKYDQFFDDSIAFWVNSLDEYILHWQSNKNVKFDYIGIEWNLYDVNINDNNFKNNKFYSILIHSSQSARQFEFISYIKPNLYNNIQWIIDDIPRCTFKLQNNPYPWDRNDGATIVPIRISQPTTNVNKMYDFYVNILGANLIYYANAIQSNTKTIFMALINTHIEMQFIQRDNTYGDFTLDKYENLLMETHTSIITNQYCGQDRWMDNHFAYETYVIPGLFDRIYYNLKLNNIKFTVHKNTKEHVSNYIKHQLELINYNGQYTFGMWVIQPNGQSIKMGGVISDPNVALYANTNDPQWCPKECNWGLVQGKVDMTHVYIDDEKYYLNKYMNVDIDIYDDISNEIVVKYTHHRSYVIYVIFIVILIVFMFLVFHYLWYYVCDKPTVNIRDCDCDQYIPI
eukprot:71236_1